MNEFQRTPESIRSELQELETKLSEINNRFSMIEDGSYEEKGTGAEAEALFAEANKIKRGIYELLIISGDIDGIRERLETGIAPAVELEQEEGIPAYLEPIVEDTFGIDVSTQEAMDNVDPRVFKIFHEVVNRYNLLTFESDEEEDTE